MNTLVIDGKSLSVESCLETKMPRDVKLLYDVMADTIGYVQAGRIKVGRWNERVRAKRCDAVDWDSA